MQQPIEHLERNVTQPGSRRTVILLGASNLTRGLSIVFETARLRFGSPIDAIASLGHGRSYGSWSRVIVRSLPGILECGLWSAVNNISPSEPRARPVAVITDIGNDIIYGRSPQEILQWVSAAVERLNALNAEIVITALPIAAIQRVPRWQAQLVKMVTYPGKGPDIEAAIAAAINVDQRIRALAGERELHLVEQQTDWYGFDPIHIRKRDWPRAAATIFSRFPLESRIDVNIPPAQASLRRWLTLRTAAPQCVRLAGITLSRSQPARRLPDGSTLSLF